MKKLLSFGLVFVMGFSVLFPIKEAFAASTFSSVSVGSQSGSLTSGIAGSSTYIVTVNRTGSGNLDINLSLTTSLPAGATASFSPSTLLFTGNTPASKNSTLTISTTVATPSGTTSFTVQGVDTSPGGLTKTTSGNLTIGAGTPDTTAPVITLTGSTPVTVEAGSAYVDAGATATDNIDGNITASIVTVNPVNTGVLGTYVVTYNVQDVAGNNATEVTRTVNVVDTTAPVIVLDGSNPQTVLVGQSYVEGGATVTDNLDTGLSATIDDSAVDTNTVGSYEVTYNVTDNAGNEATEVTRTVNVVDQEAPVITLIGANPQIIEVGTAYTELGATVADNADTDLEAVIDSSAVNTDLLGSYVVTYNATDNSENEATQVTRTVNVVDTTAPVITLIGSSDLNVLLGSVYSDAGATADDNYDESVDVVTTGEVNTEVLGTYTISYNATDDSENSAETVTRTVHVVAEVIEEDVCPNIEGNQTSVPEGKELVEGQCVDIVSTNTTDEEGGTISGSRPSRSIGQVLGASTGPDTCDANLIKSYLRRGQANDPVEVKKLQNFLNKELGLNIPVTGFFGPMTEEAVKQFQLKYAEEVITPWVNVGQLPNSQTATGYVYKTTLRWINHLICPDAQLSPIEL